jgi:multidrug resistance efflux pump
VASVVLKAPFASIVRDITNKHTVQAGEVVVTLDGAYQELYLAQVEQRLSALQASLEVYSDDVMAHQTKLLEEAAAQSKLAADHLREVYEILKGQYGFLIATLDKVSLSAAQYYKAEYRWIKARSDCLRFPYDAAFIKDYLTEAIDLAKKEQVHANYRLAQRQLKAPISGPLKLFIDANTPVDLGFKIGEIG